MLSIQDDDWEAFGKPLRDSLMLDTVILLLSRKQLEV